MKCFLSHKLPCRSVWRAKNPDLTKEIGLNERFLLTQNLFNGDAVLFEKTINRLKIVLLKKKLCFFKNDLAKTFDWNLKSTMVKKFIKLIERRYH